MVESMSYNSGFEYKFMWPQDIQPPPHGLIQLWEDYDFMKWCDHIWSHNRVIGESQNSCHVLVEQSPQLLRILHAITVFHAASCPEVPVFCGGLSVLLQIHVLLDFSWEELRTVLCPLRKIIGEDDEGLEALLILASDSICFPKSHFDSILQDLARGSLRLMKQITRDEVAQVLG